MMRLTKRVLDQIKAEYIDLGHRQPYHTYNAARRIRINVGNSKGNGPFRSWDLYVSPSRQHRPLVDAVKSIIRETKVGKRIYNKAVRAASKA